MGKMKWKIDWENIEVHCHWCEKPVAVDFSKITLEDVVYALPVCVECIEEFLEEFPGTPVVEI